jgi:hypothetical protein
MALSRASAASDDCCRINAIQAFDTWSDVLDGHPALRAGMTYQYDGTKPASLRLATWAWREDYYVS